MDKELDELISRYTEDLINLRKKWSQMGIAPKEEAIVAEAQASESVTEASPDERNSENYEENYPDTAVKPDEDKESISPTEKIPLADPEHFSLFSAGVYSGNQAYAIPGAKVSVYLDGKLHAFLITDENGRTKQIKLQSYPKLNTFIPESSEQTLDYSADVYAEGFSEKKGLLVSAVGGSYILLNVELAPLSERID